jgi:hypothetical protein
MICLIVRAQRPQRALQPRHPYTSLVLRITVGAAATAMRTSWSESTLHEQMIIGAPHHSADWVTIK